MAYYRAVSQEATPPDARVGVLLLNEQAPDTWGTIGAWIRRKFGVEPHGGTVPPVVSGENLAAQVRELLRDSAAPPMVVAQAAIGNKRGVAQAIEQLARDGVRRLLVVPVLPRHTPSSTQKAFGAVSRVLQRWRWLPELRWLADYSTDARYRSEASRIASLETRTEPVHASLLRRVIEENVGGWISASNPGVDRL